MTIEEVIRALRQCLHSYVIGYCDKCPYNSTNDLGCRDKLREDAIALLDGVNQQEPMVMTLEEIQTLEWGTDVWIEVFVTSSGIVHAGTVSGVIGKELHIMYEPHERYPYNYYNVFWRLWTGRPTQEQMEAIAWNQFT